MTPAPFVDYLRATVPIGDFRRLRDDLGADILSHFGTDASADYCALPGHPDAFVTFKPLHGVGLVSFPGQVCSALRDATLWNPLLAVLSAYPHRVTRIDATMDLPGVPAEPFIRDALVKGRSGLVHVTRKAIAPAACSLFMSVAPDNTDSLTAYLGRRRQTRVNLYDKARERWIKAGIVPTGELLRIECQARAEVRSSLHDAFDPAPLFWHLARDILPAPSGVPLWEPRAQGFTMEKPPTPLAAARAKRCIAFSDDLALLGRIAADMGPTDGLALVQRWACDRIKWAYDSEVEARRVRVA